MRHYLTTTVCALALAALPARAADPKPHTLTPREIAEGWLLLFDGETPFGWKIDGEAKVTNGSLVLGGEKATTATLTTRFGAYDLDLDTTGAGTLSFHTATGESSVSLPNQAAVINCTVRIDPDTGSVSQMATARLNQPTLVNLTITTRGLASMRITVPAGGSLAIHSAKLKPVGAKSLFNGKDLSGWKVFADPKRANSKFEVTKAGELHVTNGPGDLQTTGQYDNFVLQLECKSNGVGLNSGIFFRCMPDQYQNGYEAQINNAIIDNDRTKPKDAGTGAIYRRVPARKVVSNDHEWFTLTVVADGAHISTWVNGYQTVDWIDERKPADNPRQGLRTAKGHLSIQGHDPTTDLLFRNVRIVELGPTK